MSSPLLDLEPKLLWQHFDGIRQVPRPSKHEEKITEHVENWASDHGYEVQKDEAGTMVIRVPATEGHENADTVILQGHLDMVCEKNSDVDHDFMTQGIEVEVDGDWVRAKGTTLGADNGIGLAAAMALADDPGRGPRTARDPRHRRRGDRSHRGEDARRLADPAAGSCSTSTPKRTARSTWAAPAAPTPTPSCKISRRRGLLGSVPVKLAVRGLAVAVTRGSTSSRIGATPSSSRPVFSRPPSTPTSMSIWSPSTAVRSTTPSRASALPSAGWTRAPSMASERSPRACAADFREEFSATDPDLNVADRGDGRRRRDPPGSQCPRP